MGKHTAETFWNRVAVTEDENDCWLWTGATSGGGYGSVRWHGKVRMAHRVAAYLAKLIPDPKRDMNDATSVVMHGCDNKLCCNPNHLFPSTQSENVAEQHRKGLRKTPSGEDSVRALLTNAQAKDIYDRWHSGGVSARELADEYGVSMGAVQDITSRRTYRVIHENNNG
jgi:hypothetical protein